MQNFFIKPFFDAVRRWYIPLLVGLLFIITAVFAFIAPAVSFLSLAIFFSLSFLLSGISEIIFSLSNSKTLNNWGWHLTLGILTLIIGILLLRDPKLSTSVLALYVGFTFLFRSIATLSFSLDVKNYGIKNWGFLLFLGILGILASVILIVNPVLAGLSAVLIIAFVFLFLGVYNVYFAFQLRKIHRYTKKIRPELRNKFKNLQAEIYEDWIDISED